jgi:signal peptidase II
MVNTNWPRLSWREPVFAGIALFIILADQLSKIWIRSHLPTGDVLFDAGVFQIIHVENTGAAFGIFRNHTNALIAVDCIAIVVILYVVLGLRRRLPFTGTMPILTAIGLILGGLIGNMIDRIRIGHVTDFIDFKIWPVWNVADAATVVGTIILAVYLLFYVGRTPTKE